MNNTKLLEMKHVKKSFGNTEVLKDISLEVAEGEVVAIIGPSGSGKSTLLRCATLLETMDGGTLSYCGRSATVNKEGETTQYVSKDELRSLKNNFGLVFQNFNLFPHYSVMKNVTDAPVHVQKRDKKEVYEEAGSLLEKVGLADKADSYPCQLSGGQQQRVAIARAIAHRPGAVIADEPTAQLDSTMGLQVMAVFKKLIESQGTTVILTTHDPDLLEIADRVFTLKDGMLVPEEGRKGE